MILALAILASALASASAPSVTLPPPERRQELLFEAAKLGRTELILLLVQSGVDVNAYERRGFTPLILAAYNDQADTVDALIKAGADPCKSDRDQGNTALMGVAFQGYDRIAARLLKEKCDVNARNQAGQTALMMAALFGRMAQIEMLLDAGANKRLYDKSGRSAAAAAASQGNEPLAKKLRTPDRTGS